MRNSKRQNVKNNLTLNRSNMIVSSCYYPETAKKFFISIQDFSIKNQMLILSRTCNTPVISKVHTVSIPSTVLLSSDSERLY